MNKPRRPSQPWQPPASHWWALASALLAGSLPHLLRLPLAFTLIWLVLVGWRLRLGLHNRRPPPAIIKYGIIGLILALLFQTYGSLIGREPGAAMLVLMGALKLFELQQRRDALVVVLLAIFLCAVEGLFEQSLLSMLYVLGAAWLIITVWQQILFPGHPAAWRDNLRLSGKLLLQALPVMVLLFVLFPRIPGPMWRLPGDAHSGRTGLSGTMAPGEIGHLAQSEAVAFRVSFDGDLPPPELRYWRGPVFEMTDGRRWWVRNPTSAHPLQLLAQADPVHYTVTLEASNQPWLLALDMPAQLAQGQRQAGLNWLAEKPLNERIRYRAASWTAYRLAGLDAESRAVTTAVPATVSQRVVGLGASFRQSGADTGTIVNRALAYFHRQPFVYTLTPPLLGAQPVDEFLFQTRRGFCEHYAAAFTLLMRAAGLPARVVTGYQGGEYNALDDYLIVRQADAHAWSEVWFPERGWVRVDPTAAVAPERIEHPIDLGLQRRGEAVSFILDSRNPLLNTYRQLRLSWDAINYRWNQWVIGYGQEKQHSLLSQLGMPDVNWRNLALALTVTLALLLSLLALWILRPQRQQRDPALKLYERFCRKLARVGISRLQREGPDDFLHRIETERPDLAAASRQVTRLYSAWRYGRGRNRQQLRQLDAAVKHFHPKPTCNPR